MAAVLAAASYSRIGFSLCLAVRARRVRVPGGSTFRLEPGTIIGHVKTPQYEITDDDRTYKSKRSVTDYSFASTVVANKEYFSRCEIEGEDNA